MSPASGSVPGPGEAPAKREPEAPGAAPDSRGSGAHPSESGDFVVGVDGGGTGSRAQVRSLAGEELATVNGPPALVNPTDPEAAALAISRTVRSAAEVAGVALPARVLWAGLAGAGRSGAREAVEIALRSCRMAETVRVGMDVEGAHWDAFGKGPGVLLVLGTGSMVWGRDPEGREIRVGGWGSLLGDEGGGYWLGLQGLRAVARARDGRGPPTLLTSTLLEKAGLSDPPALIPWTAAAAKGEVAALAPLVLAAAEQGDPPARVIFHRALEEIRRHLEVIRRAWEPWGPPIPMAMVGGMVEGGGSLNKQVTALILETGGRIPPDPVLPVRGAAKKALALVCQNGR